MEKIYTGKVRYIYDIGYDCLLLEATDKVSAFDRHLCYVENKGILLNYMSLFWFNKTKHIIQNHLLYVDNRYAIVKMCNVFKIEVVVRGYITGNTKTSLWTKYKDGCRDYCGNILSEGLKKNQKLDKPIITPTTKDTEDIPITSKDIVDKKYMTQEEMEFIFEKALELYNFGSEYSKKKNLILVDTKYEFGKDKDGNIILIDELHTCDSSRYWDLSTYQDRFDKGLEPEKMDKDQIRDYVRTQCDPYGDVIGEIPKNIKDNVFNSYNNFYKQLTNRNINFDIVEKKDVVNYFFENIYYKKAIILYGSESDIDFVKKIESCLLRFNIYSKSFKASAHKNTRELLDILDKYKDDKLVWVTVAGMSNALSGVVSANTKMPCIACPPLKDKMDLMINVFSSLQMPSNVPSMTILQPQNVAMAINNIYNLL